jgi:putative colanic acid biosynthesis UDP-glucose lipid carrier transferase
MCAQADGPMVPQAMRCDERVMPVGAFLRRTSIDASMQFFDEPQGRRSVVGPRPRAVAHSESCRKVGKRHMIRHRVKPRITGWVKVNGARSETHAIGAIRRTGPLRLRPAAASIERAASPAPCRGID